MTSRFKLESRLKRVVFEEILQEDGVVRVVVRSRGAIVPPSLASEPLVVLDVFRAGLAHPPVADLEIDDDGWSATLSFGGQSFHCVVPWETVYSVANQSTSIGLLHPSVADKQAPPEPQKPGLRLVP